MNYSLIRQNAELLRDMGMPIYMAVYLLARKTG